MSPPSSFVGTAAGLRTLVNLSTSSIPFLQCPIDSTRSWINAHPAVTKKFLAGFSAALRLTKSNKKLAVAAMKKFAHISSATLLSETYAGTVGGLAPSATPSKATILYFEQHFGSASSQKLNPSVLIGSVPG